MFFDGHIIATTNHAGDINDNHSGITCEVELDISTLPLKLKSNSNTPSKPLNMRGFSVPNAFVKIINHLLFDVHGQVMFGMQIGQFGFNLSNSKPKQVPSLVTIGKRVSTGEM